MNPSLLNQFRVKRLDHKSLDLFQDSGKMLGLNETGNWILFSIGEFSPGWQANGLQKMKVFLRSLFLTGSQYLDPRQESCFEEDVHVLSAPGVASLSNNIYCLIKVWQYRWQRRWKIPNGIQEVILTLVKVHSGGQPKVAQRMICQDNWVIGKHLW